jgi:hypothetical protein
MKKEIFRNFPLLSIIALFAFCLSAYTPVKKTNKCNHSTDLIKKKEAGADLEIIRKRIIEDLLEPGINEKETGWKLA